MAKTPASILITDLANRMGLNPVGATERVDMLRQLNISQREICQEHSLRFLMTGGTLSVVASAAVVPATIDDSKALVLGRVSLDGELPYVELDSWFTTGVDTYGQGSAQTEPTMYTIAGAAILFKPPALTATVPYLGQFLLVNMTDSGTSYSMLPEGWEDTLLLIDAEAELRRVNNEPQVADLKARANDKREKLYAAYRTTKAKPWVDREQKERKIERSQLSDEAMP